VKPRAVALAQHHPQVSALLPLDFCSELDVLGSPVKKPTFKINKLQAPEENSEHLARKLSTASAPVLSGIQIYRTKELPASSVSFFCRLQKFIYKITILQDLNFNDSVTFHISDNIKYFNFGVWSTQTSSADGKDVLLGHISIPMHKIVDKCTITGLGHLIKKWQLLEPCTVKYAKVNLT
jgi:hypothetical protein